MTKKSCFLALFWALTAFKAAAQLPDSVAAPKPEIRLSGFADVFFAYDFNQPQTPYRQPFFYNHNRHQEFNLNLGLIKIAVQHPGYRANLALQAGTYPLDNYAAEPGVYRHIFEANAGLSLSSNNTLWLDAGILPSHIGFESAISIDNQTLTRSLLAENSPYYLAGTKLTYNPNPELEMAVLICNGWQRIQRVPGNSLPAFGTQLTFNPNPNLKLNWSTFIGTDAPDSTRTMRYFNNFYGQLQISEKAGLIAGFDIGFQQQHKKSNRYDLWFSPVLIGRYAFTRKVAVAARAEYYSDPENVIVEANQPGPFRTMGASLNLDYARHQNALLRLEGRFLNSREKIFTDGSKPVKNNFTLVASLAIKFENRE